MVNHNQNSYIRTQCEEAHLILRQVSEVRSFHPAASSWQRLSANGESCPRSVIPPPDSLPSQKRLCLSCVISLDLVNARTGKLCWKCVLLNHLLKQFSMIWFPSDPRSPPALAGVANTRGFREPGRVEAAAVGER